MIGLLVFSFCSGKAKGATFELNIEQIECVPSFLYILGQVGIMLKCGSFFGGNRHNNICVGLRRILY